MKVFKLLVTIMLVGQVAAFETADPKLFDDLPFPTIGGLFELITHAIKLGNRMYHQHYLPILRSNQTDYMSNLEYKTNPRIVKANYIGESWDAFWNWITTWTDRSWNYMWAVQAKYNIIPLVGGYTIMEAKEQFNKD